MPACGLGTRSRTAWLGSAATWAWRPSWVRRVSSMAVAFSADRVENELATEREGFMAGRDFNGWTVLVTGASTGLGRAIAVETAERGAAAVVINYVASEAEAKETARLVE